MPRLTDCIVTHTSDRYRHYPTADYRRFLAIYHAKGGLGPLPPADQVEGQVAPYIDLGRWIAQCDICRTAVVAEPDDPYFCCPACGSGGMWRQVVFPADRTEIERLLLRRPGFRNFAPARNWLPHESLQDLRDQNRQLGVEA